MRTPDAKTVGSSPSAALTLNSQVPPGQGTGVNCPLHTSLTTEMVETAGTRGLWHCNPDPQPEQHSIWTSYCSQGQRR
ncbi:hypothetical protein GN956_G1652 [Arapaima gigas]